jgi:outer membrane receptor protein involved in Fe transport
MNEGESMSTRRTRLPQLLCRSVIYTLAATGSAYAQAPDAGAGVQSVGGDSESQLQSVVVTAQRREQRLQDVPVAVSVVSGSSLESANIRSLEDLSEHVPALKITTGVLVDLLNIRGVGSGNNPGFEQSVATFEDGVYRARSRATRVALFDIDQVEVLKGPQTTFFGDNAIAGALNISTRKPGPEFAYNGSATYGFEDGEYDTEGGVTLPASDTLSFRVAARLSGMQGYVDNGVGGKGPDDISQQGRLSMRWTPNADLRSDLRIDYGHSRTQNAFPFELIGCPPPAPFANGPTTTCARFQALNPGQAVDGALNYHSDSPPTFANYDFMETAFTNALQVGTGTLSSITGYFNHNYSGRVQFVPMAIVSPVAAGYDGFPAQSYENYHQISQELRYQSAAGGVFEYMFGTYYSTSDLHYTNFFGYSYNAFGASPSVAALGTTAATPITARLGYGGSDRTLSGFASATIRPFDGLRINLGARYTSVHKTATRTSPFGTSNNDDPSTFVIFPSPQLQAALTSLVGAFQIPFANPSRTDDKFMPSAGVQYDVTQNIMSYATFTQGFKAGGYSFTGRPVDYNPETVNAYEVGLKGQFFDRRLAVNADVFRSNYQNLQESTIITSPFNPPFSLVQNAAQSRSQGVELNAELALMRHLSITTDLAYLDSKYLSYPAGACTILGSATGCVSQDLSGKQRPYSPKYSGNLGLDMRWALLGNEIRVNPSVYVTSGFFESATADPLLYQGGYAKFDMRIGYGPDDGRWAVAVIGRNLTDRLTSGFRQSITGTIGATMAIPDPPRVIALQFSIRN